jgi:MFS family permease
MKKLTARLSGKAYGMFNLRWLHVGSVTVFSIESTVCGAAPNMNALIIGRVIAGAGGAGMYLGLLNLIAINTTARERPAYMGAFADSSTTWRWVGVSSSYCPYFQR